MDGVLIVDKEKGWTSHDVCAFIRSRFKIAKVGHGGTLDPMATGVLVILLGRATKMFDSISGSDKQYAGTIKLGVRTDTHDMDGKILEEKPWDFVTEAQIREAASWFHGEIDQLPPMVSALKHKGVRLYQLARRGQEIERETRKITVHRFEIQAVRLPEVDFFTHVSKGTYVRTLAHDLGARLGTCAALSQLRRVKSGDFSADGALTIAQLKQMELRELMSHIRMSSAALMA